MDINAMMLTIGAAFILAVIIGPLLIPVLRRMKFGQQIRTDGPQGDRKSVV